MFATDSLSELNFVLEFNLPKEISDNQECIKLSVNHVDIPIIKLMQSTVIPGQISCIGFYESIKDILHLIQRWITELFGKSFGFADDSLYIGAKLYGYNKSGNLITAWKLNRLYPMLMPSIYEAQAAKPDMKMPIELQFSFATASCL
jgi:hypothetical protein